MTSVWPPYLIITTGLFTLLLAAWRSRWIARQPVGSEAMQLPANRIAQGASAFLRAEYRIITLFVVPTTCLLAYLGHLHPEGSPLIGLTFLIGALFSALAGIVGMRTATAANVRTAQAARHGLAAAFALSFAGGAVMGMAVVGLALLGLGLLLLAGDLLFVGEGKLVTMVEVLTGFALGAETVALFARVAGGIYTKAADVGADIVGKTEAGLPEDDPRNPAVIADNVGDNVGDVAGMGADLFGSYASTLLAAMVLGTQAGTTITLLPLYVAVAGTFVSLLVLSLLRLREEQQSVQGVLDRGNLVAMLLAIVVLYPLITYLVPAPVTILECVIKPKALYYAMVIGLLTGYMVTLITAYYTTAGSQLAKQAAKPTPTDKFVLMMLASFISYTIRYFYTTLTGNTLSFASNVSLVVAVRMVISLLRSSYSRIRLTPVDTIIAQSATGPATNLIAGLSVGMASTALPTLLFVGAITGAYTLAGTYGVALAAVAMMATTPLQLAIDAFGPIADNAGGIAEMAGLPAEVRKRTDILDTVGNTTAATGKGFAIASAALTSVALFAAFIRTTGIQGIDLAKAPVLAGLLLGSMVPFLFSALAMQAVGTAAMQMVHEVRRQLREIPGLLEGRNTPDYDRCIAISTYAALWQTAAPAALAILTPLAVGMLGKAEVLGAFLAGVLVSGVMMALFQCNAGGAWDNAKKAFEQGVTLESKAYHKGSDLHKAAVVGDTVGDPFKDTSGPAMNILIKLTAIVALIMAPFL